MTLGRLCVRLQWQASERGVLQRRHTTQGWMEGLHDGSDGRARPAAGRIEGYHVRRRLVQCRESISTYLHARFAGLGKWTEVKLGSWRRA